MECESDGGVTVSRAGSHRKIVGVVGVVGAKSPAEHLVAVLFSSMESALARSALSSALWAGGGMILVGLLAMSPSFSNEQSTVTPAPRIDEGILARQSEVLRRAHDSAPVQLVFVGDSITQAWEDGGAEIWKERFAPSGALNLGVSGDRTEHVLWRLDQAPLTRLDPKAVILLIGTNNLGHGTATAAQTFAGVRAVIAKIQSQVPKARILLCAIFPREEEMSAMRGDVAQVNQALASAFANDSSVRMIDLCASFVGANGKIPARLMPDFLHLSPAGYQVWADGIRVPLADALK